jgi:uncharacterized membrane protein
MFKEFKKFISKGNVVVLGSGILIGAIWFSNVMMFLYEKHEIITKFSFIGLIFGVIVLLKLMKYLLDKKFGLTYSIIIGFVIGSILALIPKFSFNLDFITGVVIMLLCFTLSYKLTK